MTRSRLSAPRASTPPLVSVAAPDEVVDSRTRRTVQAVLDQAERLFAQRGVSRVSLREIVKLSGQRNASVANYHFGSREALIIAVVERRRKVVNEQRNHHLDALILRGHVHDVRQLMGAAVHPLAQVIATTDWGASFVQITSELTQYPPARPEAHWNPAYLNAMDRIDAMVHTALPDMPRAELARRLLMLRDHVNGTLSAWTRRNGPVTEANIHQFHCEVETLIDFIAGGVTARPSLPEVPPPLIPGTGVSTPVTEPALCQPYQGDMT